MRGNPHTLGPQLSANLLADLYEKLKRGGKVFFTLGGNTKSTMDMLNANKVNAACQNFYLPQFCESFCDSGRILRFKKSVKYSCSAEINGVPGPLN